MEKSSPDSFRTTAACHAFTLIELSVVLAVLAIFFALLIPGLWKGNLNARTTACTANFRQWTLSANLYARDNLDWLPSFNPAGGGMFAWDVGTNFCDALIPYGQDVPTWFCPMRPAELEAANDWATAHLGHPILNVFDLRQYVSSAFPGELMLRYNYWVPRTQGSSFPTDYSVNSPALWPAFIRTGQPASAFYGWPKKLYETAAVHVPFISDVAASGQGSGLNSPLPPSPEVTNIAPNTAHFSGSTLLGVNAAFTDGRVEFHTPSKMRAVYTTTTTYWFY